MIRVGILGAMDAEISAIRAEMKETEEAAYAGEVFTCGILGHCPVVLVKSGVGKVNAAMTAQILLDRFSVTHLVNTGVGGALDDKLHIGDIAISTEAMYHDVDSSAANPRYLRGQVPHMDCRAFPADPTLWKLSEQACQSLGYAYALGRIVSGDQFIGDAQAKADIVKDCGGICAEMEGTAVAHVAYRNHIPCVILRSISDGADNAESYRNFKDTAAARSAALTLALCEHL